jgi:cytochrome c-type biogenesis protein CcmH
MTHRSACGRNWLWGGLLLAGLLAFLLAATASAQVATPAGPATFGVTDNSVNAIAKQLYCPVCENIPLDVCPTQACIQWRALIHEKLAAGWSEDQIKDYFVAQYGDRVLATPPARGLNWLVYVIPPLAIALGVYVLYRAMRGWRRPAQVSPGSESNPAPAGDEYVARLEEELRRR